MFSCRPFPSASALECREADVGADVAADPRETRKKRRVWEDPDDPSLVVSVAGQPRARRLRETEDERELTGAHS